MFDCVAVIGSGSAGMRHIETLQSMDGMTAVAVPRRSSRLKPLESAGYKTASTLQEAIQAGAQCCIVSTDTRDHLNDAIQALEYGLDVLVEKPMAIGAVEANDINHAAATYRKKVFVGCVLRFSESLGLFRDSLPRIGRLHSARIECRSFLPDWRPLRPYRDSYSSRSEDGGVLRDLIHEIDYAGWLYGWPRAVRGHAVNLGRLGIESEEIAELEWETRDGATVSIGLDYLSRPPRRTMCASGEFGTIEWDAISQTVTVQLADAKSEVTRSTQTREQMVCDQDRAFARSEAEIDSRLATGVDGMKALAVCDSVRRATVSRREEVVEYFGVSIA